MSQLQSTTTTSQVGSDRPAKPTNLSTTKPKRQQQLTVVVPLFNEIDCVTTLMCSLAELESELSDRFEFEIVLVDDGSNDGTAELLVQATADRVNYHVVHHEKNRGIAAAIHTGICHAQHEIVVSIDSDGSYDALLIEQMVPLLTPEVDVVTASPYHPSGAVLNVPWWRLWLSKRASGLYGIAIKQKLHCYTSCFRVYRRAKVIDLEPVNAGYVGVAELMWRLDRQGSQIVECPATLRTRVAGHSKMRVFRSSLRHLHLVTQILRDRFVRRMFRRSA